MPKNKNASFRYRVIDQCLRNTARRWTLQDLIDKVSDEMYEHFGREEQFSKRTIQYDLNVMRSDPPRGFGAPIESKDGFYYYEDPNFSINQNPLNETDIENLREAIDILSHFKGLPIYQEMENILGKIQQDIFTANEDPLIDFENVEELKNINLLGKLYPLLKEKQVLRIDYKPFKKSESLKLDIHPYLLKEYNNRWFLLGWSKQYKNFSILALDRIQDIRNLSDRFIPDHKERLLKLLQHIIGVSIPENTTIKNIKIEVMDPTVPYFQTKPIHPSQKLEDQGELSSIFSFQLIPNYELEQLLLSFGENVKVLEPKYFREQMKARAEKLKNRYNG
jgi:predicted DNA-binding transcriptional regulator YafY